MSFDQLIEAVQVVRGVVEAPIIPQAKKDASIVLNNLLKELDKRSHEVAPARPTDKEGA